MVTRKRKKQLSGSRIQPFLFYKFPFMGFARLFFAILLFSAGFVCAETPFGMVYGKVVKQYSVPSADSDSLDFDAMLKLYDQVEAGRELTLKQPDLPENVRYMLSEPPIDPRKKAWNDLLITPDIEGGGDSTIVTQIQVLKVLDSTGNWVSVQDSTLKLYALEDTTRLTYNIKDHHFYKFGPVARIDSLPRVFRPHHFSRPVYETELYRFPYKELSEYTRFRQYIQLDPLNAPPLRSTALRYIQSGLYDSIPELLKIDRQLQKTYGVSPLQENESLLALLGNDADYFKTIGSHGMDNIPYIFRKSSPGDTSLRQKLIEAFIDPDNDYRFEKTIKVFPKDIRAQLRVARAYERGTYTYDQPLFESIVQTNADSVQDENSRKRILNYLMLTENRPREKKAKPYLGQIYLYFGGEAQLLRNGAQKVFKSDHQMGINWMGIGGCVNSLCADYEVTFFYSRKTGEDHVVNDTLYNRENGDVRMSLLLEWRPIYNPRFDVRAYIGYNCNLYSFKIDSDFEVDKKHQYNNIGDFADFSLGGMLNFSPFEFELGQENGEWKIYTGFRLKAGYIFLNTPEFNHLNGGGVTAGFYVYVGV